MYINNELAVFYVALTTSLSPTVKNHVKVHSEPVKPSVIASKPSVDQAGPLSFFFASAPSNDHVAAAVVENQSKPKIINQPSNFNFFDIFVTDVDELDDVPAAHDQATSKEYPPVKPSYESKAESMSNQENENDTSEKKETLDLLKLEKILSILLLRQQEKIKEQKEKPKERQPSTGSKFKKANIKFWDIFAPDPDKEEPEKESPAEQEFSFFIRPEAGQDKIKSVKKEKESIPLILKSANQFLKSVLANQEHSDDKNDEIELESNESVYEDIEKPDIDQDVKESVKEVGQVQMNEENDEKELETLAEETEAETEHSEKDKVEPAHDVYVKEDNDIQSQQGHCQGISFQFLLIFERYEMPVVRSKKDFENGIGQISTRWGCISVPC